MLNALCEYYDCLRAQPDSGLIKDGYTELTITWNVVLNVDGTLAAILPYTKQVIIGKKSKTVGRQEVFPFRNSISGIAAETIDHRGKYIFGLEWNKEEEAFEVNQNSIKAFEKCKEVNLAFLDGIHTSLAESYRAFMQTWVPQAQTQNPVLLAVGKEFDTAKFVITARGEEDKPLNAHPEVCAKWEKQFSKAPIDTGVRGQCAISGEDGPIARTHDALKGIFGGLATGVNLVCFNNTAFESYGKTQSFNSSISVDSMKKYTKAFNYLAASQAHKQLIGDMTLLYWANTTQREAPYLDLFGYSLFASSPTAAEEEILHNVFEKIAAGQTSDLEGINFSTDFYLLGIKPNSSRLSVKIFEKNSFGKLMQNVTKHCRDLSFSPDDRQLSVWEIDKALLSPVSQEKGDPALQAKLLMAIVKGTPYPQTMLNTVVRRCRVDRDDKEKKFYAVSNTRARVIKACLIRKKYIKEEEYHMLQEDSTNTAYQLGRLFAVLEKAQTDALGNVNATIKDKFFSSACSTPYLVFPRLLKLTQTHLAKLSDGGKIYMDKLIQEILSKVNAAFPRTQNMEEQGMFLLGYYQQKQKLYTKSENKTDEVK